MLHSRVAVETIVTERQRIFDAINLREDEAVHILIGHAVADVLDFTLTTVDYVDALDDVYNGFAK
ncbi:hypothetical protein, partial [Segatella paludivivens]|uniref:hypothetical protein n=1 Tax=Segatella paludivivens TaxID=185294 RepID=UPI001F0A6E3D